jgi:hypothetical protein
MFLLLAACGGGEMRPLYPPFLPPPPSGGPAEFQQGWKDGCDTGLAAHGTDIYRTAFKFTQNPSLILNPAYYQAWKDGENYCRTYIYEYSVRSMEVSCSLDGLTEDCGDTATKSSVPFLGGSSDKVGYGFMGKTSADSVMGGDAEGFLGNTTDGTEIFGDW